MKCGAEFNREVGNIARYPSRQLQSGETGDISAGSQILLKASNRLSQRNRPTYSPKDNHRLSTGKTIPRGIIPNCTKNIQYGVISLIIKDKINYDDTIIFVDNSSSAAYYSLLEREKITAENQHKNNQIYTLSGQFKD